MELEIVNRSEKILDPNMDLIDKIGTMARICYKGQGDDRETAKRIILKCIKDGHESILEHGIISLFINPENTEDSKFFAEKYIKDAGDGVKFSRIWGSVATDAQSKYVEMFSDPEIYTKHMHRVDPNFQVTTENNKIMRVQVADVRTWRQVIRERVYLATRTSNSLQFVLDLLVLRKLYEVDGSGVLFGDLVENVNSLLAQKDFRDRMLIEPTQENIEYDLTSVTDHYFKDPMTVIAEQASGAASLSVIITTDRATTHQLVRHRKNVAYSQESQRYVNYDKKGFRVIPLTVEPTKYPWLVKDADYDTGRVSDETTVYKSWRQAIENAFASYSELLHYYDEDKGGTGKNLPPETCRGVLPNDTATTIGVTWFRPSSFINFCFWRLDSHAQYAIRSMIARIVKDMYLNNHPFCETLPFTAAMDWMHHIKDQKLFKDLTPIDVIIQRRTAIQEFIEKELKRARDAKQNAEK